MLMAWKPKMKLMCHNCGKVSKLIVDKVHASQDDMAYRIKCDSCGEYYVTEDLLQEMEDEMKEVNK